MAIRTSEQTEDLMVALARAQGKFGAAIKNTVNPAFRSKYADMSSIIDATLGHLNAEGIVVMQHPSLEYKTVGEGVEAYVTVTTRLQLKAQWIESDMSIPAVQRDRFDAQSVGSAITYGCRYPLQSILVVPREDDDGNQAAGRGSADAAQAVAAKKIADFKAKKDYQPAPTTLFYVWPEKHNGNYAEFMNYKEYAAGLDQVAAEGLRKVIAPFASKNLSKIGSPIIPHDQMQSLLEKLAGDCGIEVHELKANREPGSDA